MVFGFLEKSLFRRLNANYSSSGDLLLKQHGYHSKKDGKPGDPDLLGDNQSQLDPRLPVLRIQAEEAQAFQAIRDQKLKRLDGIVLPLISMLILSWLLGSFGASWAWLLFIIGGTWAFVQGVLDKIIDDFIRSESLRIHRKRALQSDETCEWLNFLLNRWWVFSSASIFSNLKYILDPKLQEAKPAFLEAISLKHLDLGNQTPHFSNVKSWDVQMGPKQSSCLSHTPPGLAMAPTHTVAFVCDIILDSEAFTAVLEARIGHKGMGVDLEVGIERLTLEGQVLVTLFLDSDAPFPHVSRFTLCFTQRPKVNFRVKILKSVQMMEVPILKTWLQNLVNDALETAWVDPGQLEINIHSNEAYVPEQRPGNLFAQGVLVVMIRIQKSASSSTFSSGSGSEEDKWLVVSVDGKTHISTPMKSALWQFPCSFLLTAPLATTNLVLKVKTKRLYTTTLTQYDLPLNQYGLEQNKRAEIVLQKKGNKVIGGNIPAFHVRMEYTPLQPINLDAPIPTTEGEDVGNGAGVLYIIVHGASNLISPSENLPSPYCLVLNNRKKVKTTHYVNDCSSPNWECSVEILVSDVSKACITFVVCSLPKNPKMLDGDLLGIHTSDISKVELPLIYKQIPLNKNFYSSPSSEEATFNSSLRISIVFRSVPSISGCSGALPTSQDSPHYKGFPLSIPTVSCSSIPSTGVGGGLLTGNPNNNPLLDPDDEEFLKKKSNTHWFNQAKNLIAGSDTDSLQRQDLGDILASGLGLIELTILKAMNLISKDLNGFSDPYCVVKVNGEVKYRTRVRKKTLDPQWNESLMTHLPKKDQSLNITLWDHDAFGLKDFLGSISLHEEQVRTLSTSKEPVWFQLDDVKSGSLQLRIKIISEDCEFEGSLKPDICLKQSFDSPNSSTILSSDSDKDVSKASSENIPSLTKKDSFYMSLPNRSRAHLRHTDSDTSTLLRVQLNKNLLRTASNPSLGVETVNQADNLEVKNLFHPLYTPSRTRKSGAEILESALAEAKAESMESLNKSNGNITKELPKMKEPLRRTESRVPPSKDENLPPKRDNNLSFTEKILSRAELYPPSGMRSAKSSSNMFVTKKLSNLSSSSNNSSMETEKDSKDKHLNKKNSSSSLSIPSISNREFLKMNKTTSNYEMESIQPLSNFDVSANQAIGKVTEDNFGLSDEDEQVDSKDNKGSKSPDAKGFKGMKQKLRRFRRK